MMPMAEIATVPPTYPEMPSSLLPDYELLAMTIQNQP